MKPTNVNFLANACGGEIIGANNRKIFGVKIDSRESFTGDMFVCIVGENNDGHNYIQSAYENGCRTFLISEDIPTHNDATYIKVKDTYQAFCKMSEEYLKQFEIIKIGVTGSVGKTTTKMLTAAVMGSKYHTIATRKNLNTDLGLALTCFDVDDKTEVAVFEMGMDKPGEIAGYVKRVKPNIAIITNIGVSHLERLGTRDAIADAKLEIVNEFEDTNILIVNSESDYLKTKLEIRERAKNKANFTIISVGQDVKIDNIRNRDYGIKFSVNGTDVHLPLIGKHNAMDAALACAAGMQFGISLEGAAKALEQVKATDKRLKVENLSNIILIDDSYNASPDSVKAGIAAIEAVSARRKIVVLGDMLELGSETENGHIQVGACVSEARIDILVAVGRNKDLYKKGLESVPDNRCIFVGCLSLEEAKEKVLSSLQSGDAVLVKGSNSTKVSEIAQAIREK